METSVCLTARQHSSVVTSQAQFTTRFDHPQMSLGQGRALTWSANSVQDRNIISSKEWRQQIQDVDSEVFRTLRQGIQGGFDEEKYGDRIGFGNLKK